MFSVSAVFGLVLLSGSALGFEWRPPVSFVLIGDSTTANGTSVKSGGWGNGFCGSEINGTASSLWPGTPCVNTGHNGATTGTFVAEGWWNISVDAIKAEVAAGQKVYATVQFGHNDMKIAEPESMGQNLTTMVKDLRALGAEPILVTPITRRNFNEDGKAVNDTLGPWADITKSVAKKLKTHLLDLHGESVEYINAIGEDAAARLNKSPDDYTHMNNYGSIVFGRMVADLIFKSYGFTLPLIPIIPNLPLSFNISQGIASY